MKPTSKIAATLLKAVAFCTLLALGVFAPKPVRAQVVVCANCSQVLTQLMEYAEQLAQYAKQVQQYELQLEQYRNMVQNTKPLQSIVFDNALQTVRQVESIMNDATNIRYMMSNLDGNFRFQYRDVYQEILALRDISDPQSLLNYSSRQQQALDTARSALKAAQWQSYDLADDQYRMDRAGYSLVNADGNLDAMQAAGEYAQMTAQQLMKMRQLALVQIQVQSTMLADQTRSDTLQRAATAVWTEDRPSPPADTRRRADDF